VRTFDVSLAEDTCDFGTEHRVPTDGRRDITRLGVDHGSESVVVEVGLRRVTRHPRRTYLEVALRTPDSNFTVDLYRGLRGSLSEVTPTFDPESHGDGCGGVLTATEVPCDGLEIEADRRHDQVVVTVPRTCLDAPTWVRAGALAATSTVVSGADPSLSVSYDVWAPDGRTSFAALPPFGPKVLVG
jgi:hypothetical protein